MKLHPEFSFSKNTTESVVICTYFSAIRDEAGREEKAVVSIHHVRNDTTYQWLLRPILQMRWAWELGGSVF